MCIIDCLSTIVFILPLHLDYTKVIILILWWRNFQLEYWRTFQLVSTYNSEPDVNITITLADQAITLGKQNEYVTLINIANYYKFITDSSGNLLKGIFESNVRDYQGNNSVNSCIANTLKNKNAEDFGG